MKRQNVETSKRRNEEAERPRVEVRVLCYVVSALALGGAGAYVIFGARKDIGILAVILAAIAARILVLNIAEGRR